MTLCKNTPNNLPTSSFYFWRTCEQKEIDLIEDRNGNLSAFECKWTPAARAKVPADWTAAYPDAQYTVATSDNWQSLLEG